jgi:hypothetical protein
LRAQVYENFEEQNNVLGPSIIIINYYIISNNAYYNYINNAQYNYHIPHKGLIEEWDKEQNVEVTGAVTTSCLERRS